MAVDWLATAEEERRLLYRSIRKAIVRTDAGWDAVFKKAFGFALAVGEGYIDNFRSGKISRKRAHQLYEWLQREHVDLAAQLEAEIFALYDAGPAGGPWSDFLEEHGQYGLVTLRVEQAASERQSRTGRIEAHKAPPPIHAEVLLNAYFRLSINSPIRGHAIGLQWIRGRWFYLPLSRDGSGIRLSSQGTGSTQILRDAFLNTRFLEAKEAGLHCLVLLVAPVVICEQLSDALASPHAIADEKLQLAAETLLVLPTGSWAALRFNAMFIEAESNTKNKSIE